MSRDPFQWLLWAIYSRLYDRVWDNRLTDHLAARVVDLIPPGLPVDEVGAGTGLFTWRLHQAGLDVRVFEPDARMRRQLVARLPGLAVCDSAIEELSGAPGPRVVVAANVLHLVSDPGAALEMLRRRAGRDGLVVIAGPAPRASLTRFCMALHRRGEPVFGVLLFLSIHIALAPLIALGGGLKVSRRSAGGVDGTTSSETVDGVAQLVLLEGKDAVHTLGSAMPVQ